MRRCYAVYAVRLVRRKRIKGWVPPEWAPLGMRRGHPGSTPEEEFYISEDSEADSLYNEPIQGKEEEHRLGRNWERARQRAARETNPAFQEANRDWDHRFREYERFEEEMETAQIDNMTNHGREYDRERSKATLEQNKQDGDRNGGEDGQRLTDQTQHPTSTTARGPAPLAETLHPAAKMWRQH